MAVINSSTMNFKEVADKFLNQWYKDTAQAVEEAVDEVSKEAVKKLKTESTSKFGSGPYSKGWTRTREKGRYKVLWTVHGNKPTYSMAHLLEHGHANRNGGRTPGYVHISPIEEWAVNEAIDRTVQKLE